MAPKIDVKLGKQVLYLVLLAGVCLFVCLFVCFLNNNVSDGFILLTVKEKPKDIKLAKVNCYSEFTTCQQQNILHYPIIHVFRYIFIHHLISPNHFTKEETFQRRHFKIGDRNVLEGRCCYVADRLNFLIYKCFKSFLI